MNRHPSTRTIKDPDAEVIALSPKTLMATNRFICEVCNKGFQREQNLQLHRRGHNLPWKLRQKTTKETKRKVYLCPELTCVHHNPSRALGDLTGIKKHYSRKHGEKKWKCEKCSKRYAVQSDWKAHSKTCGTREYRCDCGTLFSRRDSFITHRAFCDVLAQESARHPTNLNTVGSHLYATNYVNLGLSQMGSQISPLQDQQLQPSANILRLGNAGAAKFEHLIPPSNQSSFRHPFQPMPSPAFLVPDSSQSYIENQPPSGSLLPNKQFHGLIQHSDFESNTNSSPSGAAATSANLFNHLSFLTCGSRSSSISNTENANNNNLSSSGLLLPDQLTSHIGTSFCSSLLSSTSVQQENPISPHISATALLQKAAQMGSTTSRNGSSLLSRSGSQSDIGQLLSSNLGGSFRGDEHEGILRSQLESENNLQGLMNSLANGSSSSFFGTDMSNVDEGKMNQIATVSLGGSDDRLTLDFLGVGGEMVRSGRGYFQRQQQHGIGMGSLDSETKSAQASRPYNGP
ncbi:protein indeterminate-domain 5, chloroplastic-like isoform X2 [Malania oleifera]|uniref:protein indeterminate-domain 5, chloroplastic-like isoform X2 n=1 Tax=Malania oleifera TaxID=397392 RepID=UPI0025ADCF67|nr:protein indeterminate-domain 5, chloroplastic-like isoform X2 [Malania oleifera]